MIKKSVSKWLPLATVSILGQLPRPFNFTIYCLVPLASVQVVFFKEGAE